MQMLRTDSGVTSLSMDDLNNEGMVGTTSGSIYYVNFNQRIVIKTVASVSEARISAVKLITDGNGAPLFLTGSSNNANTRVWATQSVDQVMKFNGSNDDGSVVFVLSCTKHSKKALVGFSSGLVKLVNLGSLKVDGSIQVPCSDESLTSGVWSPNGTNFAFGTSSGNLYVG